MERNLRKLQNGSDIRGVAMEGILGEAVNLDQETAARLTAGFLHWLAQKTGKAEDALTISIGRDSRLTGEALAETVAAVCLHNGARVLACGLASTPAMFMTTVFPDYACDGAVMITASHLPFNRNGFKYFSRDGGLDKADITEIIAYAETVELTIQPQTAQGRPRAEARDLLADYAAHLRRLIIADVQRPDVHDEPLAGLKIVVDAGNGAGGFYATQVLAPLGADVSASQFLEPDGHFPNHAPNPEDRTAMVAICQRVQESGADFGLIFDTDVDRVSAVDGSGREINRNAIVALAAALIAVDHPGTTVVTDSITSDQLTVYLEACLGLKHLRYKRGYRNVINKAQALNAAGVDSQLAIETSGHAAYKENYFLDDGAYLATKIVIKAAQLKPHGVGLGVLLSSLEEPREAVEYRFPLTGEEFSAYGDRILQELTDWVKAGQRRADGLRMEVVTPNAEGVRINFRRTGQDMEELQTAAPADRGEQPVACGPLSGWCLLRKSLHDPIMPLNIEVTEGTCAEVLAVLTGFLCRYEQLDCTRHP